MRCGGPKCSMQNKLLVGWEGYATTLPWCSSLSLTINAKINRGA